MKNYGVTARKIRLDKGFSQKEIYTGIVSKSYAIEFEKGKHEMSISHFMDVLNRLCTNFQEFTFIHHNYQQKPESKLMERFADAANSGDINELTLIEWELHDSKVDYNQRIAALARLTLYSLENQDESLLKVYPPTDVKLIQDYLMRLDSWTMEEITLFTNSGGYFDYDVRCQLMQTVTKKIAKYHDFVLYDKVFSGLIINFLGDVFLLRDKQHVSPYLELLDLLTKDITLAFQRDIYLFYTGLNDILWGELENGEIRCRYIIQHLFFQGHQHFAKLLQSELDILLEKNEK